MVFFGGFDSLEGKEGVVAQRVGDGAQLGDCADGAIPTIPTQTAIGDQVSHNVASIASAYALQVEQESAIAQSRAQEEAQQPIEASAMEESKILETQSVVREAIVIVARSETAVDKADASRAATKVAAQWQGESRETPW